ncbi:unnamed protein product [Closterium sp. NIES-64]|nr:unnamed protein product [Closterium sp. NIES-64]
MAAGSCGAIATNGGAATAAAPGAGAVLDCDISGALNLDANFVPGADDVAQLERVLAQADVASVTESSGRAVIPDADSFNPLGLPPDVLVVPNNLDGWSSSFKNESMDSLQDWVNWFEGRDSQVNVDRSESESDTWGIGEWEKWERGVPSVDSEKELFIPDALPLLREDSPLLDDSQREQHQNQRRNEVAKSVEFHPLQQNLADEGGEERVGAEVAGDLTLQEASSVLAAEPIQTAGTAEPAEPAEPAEAAHPAALKAFYWTYVFNCFGEHSWRFAGAALLALLHHSLLPVAVASFVSQLVVFIGAPLVGELMDSAPRVAAFSTISVAQTTAMVVAALATIHAIQLAAPAAATATAAGAVATSAATSAAASAATSALAALPGTAVLRQVWFVVLVVAGAVERLTGLASGVAFERDWVIVLAGQDRPVALANANAMLRRVDLCCEVAAPLIFGWLIVAFGPLICARACVALVALSLPALLALTTLTNRLSYGAPSRPRPIKEHSPSPCSPTASPTELSADLDLRNGDGKALDKALEGLGRVTKTAGKALNTAAAGVGKVAEAAGKGWRCYVQQAVMPASAAYVLLFFNAVLSPGGLLTSFLSQHGVQMSVIAAFRGACAATGFAATFVSPPLVARLGVLQAGSAALVFQALLLALAVGIFSSLSHCPPVLQQGLMLLFLLLVVLSRVGHWTFEIVDSQIIQTAIPPASANLIGTTEIALASLAELLMLGIAIVVHDPKHFAALAAMSMAAVFAAAGVYCSWLARPDPRIQKLFPNQPEVRWGEVFGRWGNGGGRK